MWSQWKTSIRCWYVKGSYLLPGPGVIGVEFEIKIFSVTIDLNNQWIKDLNEINGLKMQQNILVLPEKHNFFITATGCIEWYTLYHRQIIQLNLRRENSSGKENTMIAPDWAGRNSKTDWRSKLKKFSTWLLIYLLLSFK